MRMPFRGNEMLEVIGKLSSQGESGRMQIKTGMTNGAVYFDKGQIVDASLGKLRGFQAINALAALREITVSFDPSIAPPVDSSITASERILLHDFFGIGGMVHRDEHFFDDVSGTADNAPAQVVPLSEVEGEVDDRDNTNLLAAQTTTDSPPLVQDEEIPKTPLTNASSLTSEAPQASLLNRADPARWTHHSNHEPLIPDDPDEVTVVTSKAPPGEPPPAVQHESVSQRRFSPALLAMLAAILFIAAAVALVYRSRSHSSPTPAMVQTPADSAEATKSEEVASAAPNLTGNWNVINTVEQTSYQRYKNLELGFELAINQTGSQFTGTGEKVSENGRSLQGTNRTPIVVQGSVDGDKVEATFSESGAARKTSGRFVWRIDKTSGRLTGTFVSTAAQARGRSAATKKF